MTTLPQTSNVRLPRPAGGALALPGAPIAHVPVASGMSAGDVWRVVRANIWLIGIAILIGAVGGFGINWYLARHYSRYTATGIAQINAKQSGSISNGSYDIRLDPGTLGLEQRNQARLLNSQTLINTVLTRDAVRNSQWFKQFVHIDPAGNESVDIAAAKLDLLDKLTITPVQETNLIEIQFTYSVPDDCQTIIQELVSQHIHDQDLISAGGLRSRRQDLVLTKNGFVVLQNQLSSEISDLYSQIAADGGAVNGLSTRQMELQSLGQQQQKAQVDFSDAAARLKTLQDRLSRGDDPAEIDMRINQDQRILTQRERVDYIQEQVQGAPQGPNHPGTRQMQQQLATMQKQLEDVEETERIQLRQELRDKYEEDQLAAQGALDAVKTRLDTLKSEQGQLEYKLFQYERKKTEQQNLQAQMQNIDKQLTDTDNQERSQQSLASLSWATLPDKPDSPSFPILKVSLGAGIGLGLVLSLAIAFARELLDQTVRSPRDISRVGQMTFLGMIPHEDDDPQVTGVPLPMVISQAPTSMIAEQFRQVRTRLQHASSLETTRTLLVTSPGPGDGKSVVASNLAAGLALNGRKILLVDANFRRPQLHKIFGVGNELGFGSDLAAPENFETAIQQTSVMNLDVLTTGPKPANPTELMESQLLIDFIEKALEEYDHIVFDSGPLLFVSETVALAPRVDGVVTVVRARANSRGLLQRMRDALRQLKAEHLGIILNAVRSQGGGYYGRNIKTYYEYQNGHGH